MLTNAPGIPGVLLSVPLCSACVLPEHQFMPGGEQCIVFCAIRQETVKAYRGPLPLGVRPIVDASDLKKKENI